MSKLRILFAMGSLGCGGSERQVLEILQHLDRSRFEPQLYLIYRTGELLTEVPADVPVQAYWDRHTFPRPNWPGRILLSQAHDLAETIRRERIDLVYDRTSQMTLTSWLATRRLRVPRVSVAVADPQSELHSSHARFKFVKRRMLQRAYRSATRVVAVSEGVREGLVKFFGLPPSQVTTCYNVFDIARLERLAAEPCAEFDRQRFHIVSVGRLQREKGQLRLLEAMSLLQSDAGKREAGLPRPLLWLVGDGPDEARLRAEVERLQLSDRVRFVGYQANPLPYVKQADLFCLPSQFEGMPNALVEAMICRTPVLSTDCPTGPSEILAGGEYGTLVPPNMPRLLAASLEDAMRNPATWRARTEAAYQSVRQRFALAAGMSRWQALLEQVVAEHGQPT